MPLAHVLNGDSKYQQSASSENSQPQDACSTDMNPAPAKSMAEPSLRALHHSIDKPTHFSDFQPLEVHLPADLCLKRSKVSTGGLALSQAPGPNMFDTDATIIDVFSPRISPFQLSPASSASSDMSLDNGRSSFDAFVETRSRVVRVSRCDSHPTLLDSNSPQLMKFSRSPTKLLSLAFSGSVGFLFLPI